MEDFLGLDHVGKSGITRDVAMGIRFGLAREIQEPVELFAEEIPRDDSEPGDHEDVANVFRFTRDVARTHGISFKFVSVEIFWDKLASLTKGKGFPAGFKISQEAQNTT